MGEFRRIVVGFDGSPGASRALRRAIAIAREEAAELWVLWVEEPLPHYISTADEVKSEEADASTYFQRLQMQARLEAAQSNVPVHTEAVRGHAAQGIADYARQIGADLIVVGQRGHGGVVQRMLGSTSDRIVDIAECSVLVVPGE
jgi:nucleotide-binding universal stress UspA family protein